MTPPVVAPEWAVWLLRLVAGVVFGLYLRRFRHEVRTARESAVQWTAYDGWKP